jgi:hypothetical protein
MRLVYFVQFVQLMLAFGLGYRMNVTPFRLVMTAIGLQVVYGLLIYYFVFRAPPLIDLPGVTIFDLYRLEKELWLPRLIEWLGRQVGHRFRFPVDDAYFVVMMTGGFFVTLGSLLSGSIFSNAVSGRRVKQARYVRPS